MSDEDDIYKILFDDDFDEDEKQFGTTEDGLCFESEEQSFFGEESRE